MLLIETGAASDGCIDDDVCTRVEDAIMSSTALLWLVTCVLAIVFGWKARLFGARRGERPASYRPDARTQAYPRVCGTPRVMKNAPSP